MRALELVDLPPLMARTSGRPEISIGLIDGPVLVTHPELSSENIREVPGTPRGTCARSDSIACSLTAVNVRISPLSGMRKIVDIIFSYTNRNTDVLDPGENSGSLRSEVERVLPVAAIGAPSCLCARSHECDQMRVSGW